MNGFPERWIIKLPRCVRPIDKQIVKDQQHLADVFFELGEILKQIRVEDAVVCNGGLRR
jgi:hypothetical protein